MFIPKLSRQLQEMAKTKQRTAANTADTAALSVNERILRECYKLYVDEEQG